MHIFSDEVLCAYIDEALSPEERAHVERALHEDDELRHRLAALRASDDALRAMAGPPPPVGEADPLADRIRNTPPPALIGRGRAWRLGPLLSVAALVGLLGFAIGRLAPGEFNPATPHPLLVRALDTARSGEEKNGVRIIVTFQDAAAAPCRQFTLTRAGRDFEGVACRTDDRWQILAWLEASPSPTGEFHAAGANEALDSYIDRLDATGALSAEDEAKFIQREWATRP